MPKKLQSKFEENVYNEIPDMTITQFNIFLRNDELSAEMIENSLFTRALTSYRFEMVVGMIRFLTAKNKANVIEQLLNQVDQAGFLPITRYLLLKQPLEKYILSNLIQYSNCKLIDASGFSAIGLLHRYHVERSFLQDVFKILSHKKAIDPMWLSALDLLLKPGIAKPEYDYQKFMWQLEYNLINNSECWSLHQYFCYNFNRSILMVEGCGRILGKDLIELLSNSKINILTPPKMLPPLVTPVCYQPAKESSKLKKDAKPFEPMNSTTLRDHKSSVVQQKSQILTLDFSHIHSLIEDLLESDERLDVTSTPSPTLSSTSTSSESSSEPELPPTFFNLNSSSKWLGPHIFFTEYSPLTQQQREEIDSLNLVNLDNDSMKTSQRS